MYREQAEIFKKDDIHNHPVNGFDLQSDSFGFYFRFPEIQGLRIPIVVPDSRSRY